MNFLHCIINFVGSWLQTPRWYKYTKSVEPLFAYSLVRGSGKTLYTRINNECPRRYVHRCKIQRIKHTKGHLPLSCSGCMKFSGFRTTKTSANKRLLLCLLPFAADVQTSPAQVHDAKVLQNLRMCKKNRILVRFSLEQISKQFQEMSQLF